MREVRRGYHLFSTGSTGRTDSLNSILRRVVADPSHAMVHLDWLGREEASRIAGSPPQGKLRKIHELSTDEGRSANMIINGDTLPAMAALTITLRGLVDLAFLDPPYNATWERWVYPDQILG